MLTLLLTNMLTLALNIQSIKAKPRTWTAEASTHQRAFHAYSDKNKSNFSVLQSFSMGHTSIAPRLRGMLTREKVSTGPIAPVAGQYANFTITYKLNNGTTSLSAFWNISYEKPTASYPGCINVTIRLYGLHSNVTSGFWWMVVNKTDRKVVAESPGVWGEGYYSYWIQATVYESENITWWSTPYANATVLGQASFRVLNRTVDSWYVYSNLSSVSPVDSTDLNNTAYFDKVSGHALQMLEYETKGYWNLTLSATNIPVGRGRVLFDLLHVEQYMFYYSYSKLSDKLKTLGYYLYQLGRDHHDTGLLTYDILENFDLLVLSNPQFTFKPSEVQAIINFVQDGGSLLILDAYARTLDITTYFGIEHELPIIELDPYVTNIIQHPITTNVNALFMPSVTALNVTSPAQGIAFSQEKPVIAVAENGSGRVVVITSGHMLTNSFIKRNENFAMALNTFGWLTELSGIPYSQELPMIRTTFWNPPSVMITSTEYTVNVKVQNLGKDPITIVVTVPGSHIFNKTGWGVGKLIGDSKSINISSGGTEIMDLVIRAPIRGYTYMRTYVYAPYGYSYMVFDGKHTDRIEIIEPPLFSIYTDKYTYRTGDEMRLGLNITNPDGSAIVDFVIWITLVDNSTYLYLYLPSVAIPSKLEYGNPSFRIITLPNLPTGSYTWHAAFLSSETYQIIIEDIAEWEFS